MPDSSAATVVTLSTSSDAAASPVSSAKFAVLIIIGWIGIVALLSLTVPPLETVGQMRSVSMTPEYAPSVIASKRVGQVFDEYKSDSSVMIVLEGEQPLGADAHYSVQRHGRPVAGRPRRTSSTSRTSGATR